MALEDFNIDSEDKDEDEEESDFDYWILTNLIIYILKEKFRV